MPVNLDFNFGYIGSNNKAVKRPSYYADNFSFQQYDTKKPKIEYIDPVDQRCIDCIRVVSADIVELAKSGHPGAAMGCAPMAHALFGKVMNFNPKNPAWPNRDRFVLSNGHACALQYTMLHLSGYDLSMDDLKQFRKLDSRTPGHPEVGITPGIEVCTGPLGQGISNAVGLALAEAQAAAKFNREGFPVVDSFTYVICGDGCLQEGISSEACSLAGHLGLGKLIVLYDDNNITIDGSTDLSFTEDVLKRYESYNWHVVSVRDGDTDLKGLLNALDLAKAELDKPTLIKVTTTIGKGSTKEGTAGVHGAPLGAADLSNVKQIYGFPSSDVCVIPAEVASMYAKVAAGGQEKEKEWRRVMAEYKAAYPEMAAEWTRRVAGELPSDWMKALPTFTPADKALATRQSSQTMINALCGVLPEMVGGSADLTPSNLTKPKGSDDFQRVTPEGRYIRFGVREHAMAAICNGIAAYGGYIPFCATFLNFASYALGAMRLSSLSHFGVIYVMTHDSIGLGEDGPTHQPIEMLQTLRVMPNMLVMRPADANECGACYAIAIENRRRPSTLCLSRQGLPNLPGSSLENVRRGAYTLVKVAKPQLILVASGSEVQLAVSAATAMADKVRVAVVSMPCWELFEEQSAEYRQQVFPKQVPVLAVEMASVEGWTKYSHACVGMTTFGASGPGKDVMNKFGFNVENVTAKAMKLLDFYKKNDEPVPSLMYRPVL